MRQPRGPSGQKSRAMLSISRKVGRSSIILEPGMLMGHGAKFQKAKRKARPGHSR
jgi:hypothetical protein